MSIDRELSDKIEEFDSSNESFVNRVQELSTLLNTTLPIVIVYGRFGQGKTKLARKLVDELEKRGEEVVYIALRLMDQKYKGEFLTYKDGDLFKTYYNSKGIIPKGLDFTRKFLAPLLLDPMGFKETYKASGEALIVKSGRPPLKGPLLKEIYEGKDIEDLLRKPEIKGSMMVIIDEFEDLLNALAIGSSPDVARRFINNLLNFSRYVHDEMPGKFRLVLLIIPRTAVDIRNIVSEEAVAWVGKACQVSLEKLSEDHLLEYAEKLIKSLLDKSLKLEDLFDYDSIKLLKVVLKGVETTRFAVDLIKQVIKEGILYLARVQGISKYDDLKRVLIAPQERRIRYNVADYLKIYEPSHDEIVRNYQRILTNVKDVLQRDYRVFVTGPGIVTLARGYESYFLDVEKGEREGNVRFMFWLRPSGYGSRELTIDKVLENLRLKEASKMKLKTVVCIVTFRNTKHVARFVDVLTSSGFRCDIWVHSDVLKYGLSDNKPSGILKSTIDNYMKEEVKRLADNILLLRSLV